MSTQIEGIELLKSRILSIIDKMDCSGNEKKLAVMDINEVIDRLDEAEDGLWDLEGYIDDIEEYKKEEKRLTDENDKLKGVISELSTQIGDVSYIAAKMEKILEKGNTDE